MREEIREYAKEFEWKKVIEKYYLPSVRKIVNQYNMNTYPGEAVMYDRV